MATIESIMSSISGATFLGLDTVTVPKLKGGKKNPMQGRIQKHMTGAQVMAFENKYSNGYENMVRRRLEKEGKSPDFEVGVRKWGERVAGLPIVAHKGKRYLEVIFLKSGKVCYTLDGNPIEKSDIEGLPEKQEGGQGGLSDTVQIRTFAVANVTRLTANGETFTNIG